ncbi:uncharacterized protein EHS24_004651 [Apiotrichum porosum]|uniref:Uncharacterized protein n=1 Tax=Apiotrichum porosum TaxID=105984 RepID=A0A427Y5P2_9TREE|nr:uncharacterized protein EHS24_004651 [Apiotrichum porosum]RSH86401.1 hypothetical protein EHS24_004651 [Apiotrichum porosum]
METFEDGHSDPTHSQEARGRGDAAFAKGDYDGAITAYTQAVNANELDSKAWNNRGLVYLRLQNWQQAEYDAKSAILIDRDSKVPNPYGYCIRSLARQGAGKVDAAIRDLKHAASLSPNDTRIQTTVSAVEAARPPCPPPPVVTIDYSAFPHLIDMVISFANAATRVSLGSTCRALREKIIKIGEHVHITTTEDGCWLLATFAQQSPMGLTFRDPTQVQGPKIHLCLVPDDHRERWADVWGIGLAKVVTLSGPMPASFVHSLPPRPEVLRIRADEKGRIVEDLSLDNLEASKIVMFSVDVKYHSKTLRTISLSHSVKRLVW